MRHHEPVVIFKPTPDEPARPAVDVQLVDRGDRHDGVDVTRASDSIRSRYLVPETRPRDGSGDPVAAAAPRALGTLWHAGIAERVAAAQGSASGPAHAVAGRVAVAVPLARDVRSAPPGIAASDAPGLCTRMLASSDDFEEWMRERRRGVTSTDAARLASRASVSGVARDKLR